MDYDVREMMSLSFNHHLLLGIIGLVSWARRHESCIHSAVNCLAEESTEIALPTEGMFVGARNFHRGGRGER